MTTGTNWTYQSKVVEELPKDCEAFVYIITMMKEEKIEHLCIDCVLFLD